MTKPEGGMRNGGGIGAGWGVEGGMTNEAGGLGRGGLNENENEEECGLVG